MIYPMLRMFQCVQESETGNLATRNRKRVLISLSDSEAQDIFLIWMIALLTADCVDATDRWSDWRRSSAFTSLRTAAFPWLE